VDHQVVLFTEVGGRLVADMSAFSAVFLIGLDPDLTAGVRVLIAVGEVVAAGALGLPAAHVETAGIAALAAVVQGILQVGLAPLRQTVAVTKRSDAGVDQAHRRLALGPGIGQHAQPPALAAVLRVVLDVGATAVAVMKTLAAIALAFPCFADLAGFAGLLAAAAMFMITRSVDATGSTLLETFFASLHAGTQLTQPAVRTLDETVSAIQGIDGHVRLTSVACRVIAVHVAGFAPLAHDRIVIRVRGYTDAPVKALAFSGAIAVGLAGPVLLRIQPGTECARQGQAD
jgi:hypothetical protein